ncbi:MAG: hypothetical protein NTV05_03540 [Acidobacteria bacterium]|nr:hypothetical protein [Acidobacteriota bacterium]
MPKQSSKRKPSFDPNLTAFAAVQHVIEQTEGKPKAKPEPTPKKNPAAVALGRLGGLKGGKARAEKLSARKRTAIARRAAEARWKR